MRVECTGHGLGRSLNSQDWCTPGTEASGPRHTAHLLRGPRCISKVPIASQYLSWLQETFKKHVPHYSPEA